MFSLRGEVLLKFRSMSSLGELVCPIDGAEFLNIDALVQALDNWAVKDKFTFRTLKRENC